jgi:hypothetical protein
MPLTDEQIQKLRDGKLSPGLEREGVIAELCTRLLSAEAKVKKLEAGAKASKEDAAFKIIALFREY